MPHDPHLADLMREALKGRPGVTEKKMFGGNMVCGVEVGRYMFRPGRTREAEALARPGATPMDITGAPMAGFVWVDADAALETGLADWFDFCARHVGALPPK